MAKGNKVIVTANPKGTFSGGYVSGTPKPGTCLTLKAGVAPVGGRFTWEAFSGASGAMRVFAILLEDELQGKLGVSNLAAFSGGPPAPGDAYVTGAYVPLYFPVAGEDFNLIVASVAGTADDVAIADLFGIETATGKLIANSAYANPCFQGLETVTDPTADYMLWCKFGP